MIWKICKVIQVVCVCVCWGGGGGGGEYSNCVCDTGKNGGWVGGGGGDKSLVKIFTIMYFYFVHSKG